MFVIPQRSPKLYNGLKVILEGGQSERIERRRFNGFKIVDDTDDEVGNDDAPTKRIKLV